MMISDVHNMSCLRCSTTRIMCVRGSQVGFRETCARLSSCDVHRVPANGALVVTVYARLICAIQCWA